MPTPTLSPVSLLDTIGRTPLLRLDRLGGDARPGGSAPRVEIYAKAEFQNPGGSVKDRAAMAIVREAERSGRLRPGGTILDATSGNTGIAYAMIAAARGYRLKLCVPGNVTAERLRTLRAYGADLVVTNPMEGTDGAIREARRLQAESPDQYFYADQYNNDANWQAHYDTTAVEILEQTDGRVTHFVAGLGTSGTFMGTGRRLRAFRHDIRLISVQPESPLNGIEGLKHMETAIRPGIYDPTLADEDVRVSTERAFALTRRLATEEGLLVGVSSGAALAAALDLAERIREGVIVTIFPDSGTRYLSESFWDRMRRSDSVPTSLASQTISSPPRRSRRSGSTAPRRFPTSVAARSSPSTDGSSRPSEWTTRPTSGPRGGSASVPTATARRTRARGRAGGRSSASTTRTRTNPPGHRRTISSTPGRISRMSSFLSGPARRVTSRCGTCETTGPDSTRES